MHTTIEEQKSLVLSYIAAYNNFDVDGMVALLHPEVVFTNVSGGEVNAEVQGIEQFRHMAIQSKKLFSSRCQRPANFDVRVDSVSVGIVYEGVLAKGVLDVGKANEVSRLKGRSEFGFRDGKISRITDFS